jgi:enoyl-CoA hydratase/carnithine racemase
MIYKGKLMIDSIDHGDVRELKLVRSPANALNPELVEALTNALQAAPRQASAVIVSGLPGMFCAGLDLPELIHFDREAVSRFWQSFLRLLRSIAQIPVPIAFALTGHAPAGGIVMALYGDYRVMPRGKFKTGLNEVQVGLVVPCVIHQALVRAIGAHTAERILVAGEIMSSERALDIGLVDELVDTPEDTVTRALEWCQQHLALPRQAMLATRSMARADLHALFNDSSELGVEKFVEIWFSENGRSTLATVVDRLRRK